MSRIRLRGQERQALQDMVRRSRDGRRVRRGQALLWLGAGERVGAVAARLGVTRQAVWHWKRRWQRRRRAPWERVLSDGPRPGRPASKRRSVTAVLPEVLAQAPQVLGYRSQAWTVPLLQHHVRKALGVTLRYNTVWRAVRGLGYRYKRPRYVLARRSPTWRQAKGGSSEA